MSTRPAEWTRAAVFDKIDAYVDGQLRRLRTPGAVLAVVDGARVVHTRGFGRARPGGETPTAQTPFFIGSLTKSITALAVMQLVEEGRVDLDAPVQRYLPWFRVADPGVSALVTVRHLLNQTSGLPESAGERALADFGGSPGAAERQARALSTLRRTRRPGAKCEYCNVNYDLLGLVVAAVSGQSYEARVQRRVFDPLQMRHSYTSKSEAEQNGLAVGHRYWFARPVAARGLPVPRGSLASGQVISCAEDMAHYLIAHLNGGRFGDARVLSEEGIGELHRGAVEYVKMGVRAGRYGMGWFDTDMGQVKTYWHTGNVPDFSAYMVLLPEQKSGAVLLANAGHYGLPPILGEVGSGVAALLADRPPGPIRLGGVPLVMRLLPLVPLLQVAAGLVILWLLGRWGMNAALRPGGARLLLLILLPVVANLALVAVLACLQASGQLRFLRLFMPDLFGVALASGGFAAVWVFLLAGLVVLTT
ncbi:MAG: serine hydrolase domain-containing protein [bacterium]